MSKFSDLVGKTLAKIDGGKDSDVLVFHTTDGERYQMWHRQDCCESVWLEDVVGDLTDLIGVPIVTAEVRTNNNEPPLGDSHYNESYTWTYYELATIKGYVTLRWYGTSNGYYSESVSFKKLDEGGWYES